MPFKIAISGVEYRDREIAISGKLIEGAYFGQEAIILKRQDGRTFSTVVKQHSLYLPEDWPVLPSHNTVLTICIVQPQEGLVIDESEPVIGRGALTSNENRTDISHVLSEPVFWAMQLSQHLASEEVDEPLFGISSEDVNDYYDSVFDAKFDAGIWPFIRLPIGKDQFVELEFAASIEHQDRFWIGDSKSDQRILLGYHSGHFSLPAFRFEEVAWLHRTLQPSTRVASLLLMTGCFLPPSAGESLELATELFSQLPGAKPSAVLPMAKAFVEYHENDEVTWQKNSDSGWINNSRYSQRNPESVMSILDRDDFAFIDRFFHAVDDSGQ